MSMEAQQNIKWSGEPMKSPLMRHFCKHTVCRNARTSNRLKKLRHLAEDPSDYDCLKETLLCLEYADWNASEARLQRDLDRIDRAGPATDRNGNEIDNHAANPDIDRRLAERGEDFDADLKVLTIRIGEQKRVFTYPSAKSMDPNSQQDINELNRWRHKVLRENVGRQRFGRLQGTDFHQLEADYLLNRYANQEVDYRGRWGISDITADYNTIFTGMLLPGRYRPCEERSKDSITSLISRKAIKSKEKGKAGPKLSAFRKHELAQGKIAYEWQQRYEENEAAADDEGDDDPSYDGDEDEDICIEEADVNGVSDYDYDSEYESEGSEESEE